MRGGNAVRLVPFLLSSAVIHDNVFNAVSWEEELNIHVNRGRNRFTRLENFEINKGLGKENLSGDFISSVAFANHPTPKN